MFIALLTEKLPNHKRMKKEKSIFIKEKQMKLKISKLKK
jgi:hypothetical protein